MISKEDIIKRFISYAIIDTESNPNSDSTPSTKKQWDLANKLAEELKAIGMEDVTIDDNAYIMATLPSNVDYDVPTIGFIAHFDTSPDFTGANVKPQIIENYHGGDILLNKEENIVLSPDYFDDLRQYIGQTLITTDGTTLLGADDEVFAKLFRPWNTLLTTHKLNTAKFVLALHQMKKLVVAPINSMLKNLEQIGLTPWMAAK